MSTTLVGNRRQVSNAPRKLPQQPPNGHVTLDERQQSSQPSVARSVGWMGQILHPRRGIPIREMTWNADAQASFYWDTWTVNANFTLIPGYQLSTNSPSEDRDSAVWMSATAIANGHSRHRYHKYSQSTASGSETGCCRAYTPSTPTIT